MTVARATGLTLADLEARVHERRLPWLAGVVEDEVERGRIVEDGDGLLRLRREAFPPDLLAALASWEAPAA